MRLSLDSTVRLVNGVEVPRIGLGTYKSPEGDTVIAAVSAALACGYRSIDTASLYGNERGIGQAIRESGVPREEVFLTSKVWNDEQGYAGTLAALDRSLERLGTSYLDLYLVHWPVRSTLDSTWRAMEQALASGTVRAIGVCNFMRHHLEALLRVAEVPPMVDQFELHLQLQQPELRAFCAENHIVVEAWAPLIRGAVNDIPMLAEVAQGIGATPAQVALRWLLQNGVVVIPKSVHPDRIRENAGALDIELPSATMAALMNLDRGERIGRDPDRMGWES